MKLQPDALVGELRRLAPPCATVVGGSFAQWLPPLTEVPRSERLSLARGAQRDATGYCLRMLLAGVGLKSDEPHHLPDGSRKWPEGFTGSVSHKGTTVVATVVRTSLIQAIGIDIETCDTKDPVCGPGLPVAERPPLPAPLASVVLFSTKEAAFKAVSGGLGRTVPMADAVVSWSGTSRGLLSGTATLDGVTLQIRCSTSVAPRVSDGCGPLAPGLVGLSPDLFWRCVEDGLPQPRVG